MKIMVDNQKRKKEISFESRALDLHGGVSLKDDQLGKHSQNGMDEERIRRVLKKQYTVINARSGVDVICKHVPISKHCDS